MQQIDNLADSIDSIYHIVICIFYISHHILMRMRLACVVYLRGSR